MLDEGHTHSLGARLDRDRLGLHSRARWVRLIQERVHVEQGDAHAVDRNFELLAVRGRAVQKPDGVDMHVGPESVLTVGREVVHDRHTAVRPDRSALHVTQLRRRAWHLVGRVGRSRVRIPEGLPADSGTRPQVPFHESRGERLDVRDVVETGTHGVGRQERGDVDVERQHVMDRPGVFRTSQTLERPSSRIRVDGRRGVDPLLERRPQAVEHRPVRTPRAGRRHHAGLQLLDHFLGNGGVPIGLPHIERCQRQTTPQ